MIGVLILNYNNDQDTINCIESVEKYNTADIKFIVVDNGSNDDCIIRIQSFILNKYNKCSLITENCYESCDLPYITFLINSTNVGYARGNNIGLEMFYSDNSVDFILILNNDIIFIQDIIEPLVDAIKSDDSIAIVSPLLLTKDMQKIDYNCARLNPNFKDLFIPLCLWYKNLFGLLDEIEKKNMCLLNYKGDYSSKIQIELPSGSCMLLKKIIFKQIGSFDPNTFLYFEENILYKKIQRIGKKNYLIPSLKCVHLGSSSIKKTSSYFSAKCSYDSMMYYLKNYVKMNLAMKFMLSISSFVYRIKLFVLKKYTSQILQNIKK